MSALKEIKKRVKELEKNSDMLDLSAINIGTITPEIRKEMEKCKNISCLNLQECALESLDNLPNWKIQVLDLSENKLTDSSIPNLAAISTLHQLRCADNQFTSLEALKPLAKLADLVELEFSSNPVAQKEDYRSWMFENLPNLEILDNKDKEGNQLEEEEFEEGDSDEEEEEWDEDQEEQEEEASESESEKPKKKKK